MALCLGKSISFKFHPLSLAFTLAFSPALSALVLEREATLGDTLNGMLGVHADTFGSGTSCPVSRGQTAPRVKILSDGSELMDASGVSPDHAITRELMLALS